MGVWGVEGLRAATNMYQCTFILFVFFSFTFGLCFFAVRDLRPNFAALSLGVAELNDQKGTLWTLVSLPSSAPPLSQRAPNGLRGSSPWSAWSAPPWAAAAPRARHSVAREVSCACGHIGKYRKIGGSFNFRGTRVPALSSLGKVCVELLAESQWYCRGLERT